MQHLVNIYNTGCCMIKRTKLAVHVLTGVVCILVCGGIFAVWAASPDSYPVSTDPRAVYSGTSETSAALMFNVYSGEEYIPDILDTLNKAGAGATFFIGGCWAEKHGDLLREIVESGYEIGSHGYLHRDHSEMDVAGNLEEMRAAHRMISAVSGVEPKLFAPPSGAYSTATLDAAEEMGYVTVLWSKDTIDWRDHDAELITERAVKDVAAGDMILMHPTADTAKALPGILAGLENAGVSPGCVSEVL